MMKFTQRTYQTEEDYWNLRGFLRETMVANGRRELNWHVARLDYWWWFVNPSIEHIVPQEQIFLWETEVGELAGFLTPEGRGQAYLQVHPKHTCPELLEAMVTATEDYLRTTGQDGREKLWIYLDSMDKPLQEILARRGFHRVERSGVSEYQHRCDLDAPLPEAAIPAGYTVRPLGDGLELLERCYASGLGFHEDDIQTARENRDDPSWYRAIQTAPLYRRDLDMIAFAADGSIASFCTIWFDDVSRTAYFEPVATVPAHQKRGLGKAVMMAGLHKLKKMGCKVAFVGGYSEAANALYFSVMGPKHDISEPWENVY